MDMKFYKCSHCGNIVAYVQDNGPKVVCCGGMERAAKAALLDSGKDLPWRVVTFSGDGRILEEQNR